MKKDNDISLRGENGKIYYGWVIVLMCLLNTTFVYATSISCTGSFMLPVTQELGFGMGSFGLYITIMSFASLLSLLFFQNKMTRKNLKKIMLISGLCTGASFIWFSFSTELWQFYVGAVFMGIGFGCMTITPTSILVANWFGSKARGFAMGAAMLGPSLGALLMINVINGIVQSVGWKYGYLAIAAGIFIIAVPATALLYSWEPEDKNIKKMGIDTANIVEVNKSGVTFKEAAKHPGVWIFLISTMLITFASSSIPTHAQTYLITAGYTPIFAGLVFSIGSGLQSVGGLIAGKAIDKWGVRLVAPAIVFIYVCTYFSLMLAVYSAVFIVLMIITFCVGGTSINVIPPWVSTHMNGEKFAGQFFAMINVFVCLGGSFGATFVGFIYDTTGSYNIAWIVMLSIMTLGGIARGWCSSSKRAYDKYYLKAEGKVQTK